MRRSHITIATPDGEAEAYVSRPAAGERHPGVLLLVDAFGLRPQIERMADRIAASGYAVLAPNTLYRGGPIPVVSTDGLDDPARRQEVFDRVVPLIRDLTVQRIVADGSAYLDRLADLGAGRQAVVGYCMGGRLGWRLTVALPDRVEALACFHTGELVTARDDSPHLSAGQLECEVYLGFADEDGTMTPDQVAVVERELTAAGATYRSDVYAGARHGFTMADTPVYDEEAAERHHRELSSLLGRTIGAGR